jgi:hypothetical protein
VISSHANGANMAKSNGLRVGFAGFLVATVGAASGFVGFAVGTRWLSLIGFAVTVIGIAIVFASIVYGWVTTGNQAIKGSIPAAKELANRMICTACKTNVKRCLPSWPKRVASWRALRNSVPHWKPV